MSLHGLLVSLYLISSPQNYHPNLEPQEIEYLQGFFTENAKPYAKEAHKALRSFKERFPRINRFPEAEELLHECWFSLITLHQRLKRQDQVELFPSFAISRVRFDLNTKLGIVVFGTKYNAANYTRFAQALHEVIEGNDSESSDPNDAMAAIELATQKLVDDYRQQNGVDPDERTITNYRERVYKAYMRTLDYHLDAPLNASKTESMTYGETIPEKQDFTNIETLEEIERTKTEVLESFMRLRASSKTWSAHESKARLIAIQHHLLIFLWLDSVHPDELLRIKLAKTPTGLLEKLKNAWHRLQIKLPLEVAIDINQQEKHLIKDIRYELPNEIRRALRTQEDKIRPSTTGFTEANIVRFLKHLDRKMIDQPDLGLSAFSDELFIESSQRYLGLALTYIQFKERINKRLLFNGSVVLAIAAARLFHRIDYFMNEEELSEQQIKATLLALKARAYSVKRGRHIHKIEEPVFREAAYETTGYPFSKLTLLASVKRQGLDWQELVADIDPVPTAEERLPLSQLIDFIQELRAADLPLVARQLKQYEDSSLLIDIQERTLGFSCSINAIVVRLNKRSDVNGWRHLVKLATQGQPENGSFPEGLSGASGL